MDDGLDDRVDPVEEAEAEEEVDLDDCEDLGAEVGRRTEEEEEEEWRGWWRGAWWWRWEGVWWMWWGGRLEEVWLGRKPEDQPRIRRRKPRIGLLGNRAVYKCR